jgi:CO/xanthine dehydrogenase FAD-binding subunit
MGARIRLVNGEQERVIPLEELFSGEGQRPIAIGTHEIATDVIVPPSHQGSGKFLKYRLRGSIDFPLVNAAVFVKKLNGRYEDVRIVVGGVDSAPLRIKEAEEVLRGGRFEEGLLDKAAEAVREKVHPVNNTGGSPAHRRIMAHILVKEALHQAWKN